MSYKEVTLKQVLEFNECHRQMMFNIVSIKIRAIICSDATSGISGMSLPMDRIQTPIHG